MSRPHPTFLVASPGPPPDVAVLASILAIEVRLMFYCLDDLNPRWIVTVLEKQLWTMVIVLGGPMVLVAYRLYGRGVY